MWDKSDENYDLLEDDEAVLAAISYTMNNPVTPGGVRFARNWPGVRVAWSAKNRAKERTFKRARPFYRTNDEGGNTPAIVTRRLYRPFGFEGISDEELARRIKERCHQGQERAGERNVIFPYGTYKMVVLHGANMAPPPPLLSA